MSGSTHGRGRGGAGPPPTKSATGKKTQKGGPGKKAVVPKAMAGLPPRGIEMTTQQLDGQTVMVPKGYTARAVKPAENYDVISFARAMNDDFGGRVKKLFDPEREAALDAQETGIYIGWRLPQYPHDCQRVSRQSKCFCGHILAEHAAFNARSVMVPCKQGGCKCKGYAWVPSRPEEVGEFWFQRRRNFDPSTWRAKCRCKHSHDEHDPTGLRRCRSCGCGAFDSNFLCAACDKHWEEHQTVFEDESARKEKGLPTGLDYLPFAEIPSLRNMVLSGEDDGDMSYMALTGGDPARAIPPPKAEGAGGNNAPVQFGAKKSGFNPVYD